MAEAPLRLDLEEAAENFPPRLLRREDPERLRDRLLLKRPALVGRPLADVALRVRLEIGSFAAVAPRV